MRSNYHDIMQAVKHVRSMPAGSIDLLSILSTDAYVGSVSSLASMLSLTKSETKDTIEYCRGKCLITYSDVGKNAVMIHLSNNFVERLFEGSLQSVKETEGSNASKN